MLQAGGGAIVNTASVAGVVADPGMSPYVAAKHGVVGLTKAAALDYARKGIRVTALAPGLSATPMTERWLKDPAFVQALMANCPIGRPAQPEEMAGMVLFLCSPAASFATGQVYLVDGARRLTSEFIRRIDTLKLRKSEERGYANLGWLKNYPSFSFADCYVPNHMGWGNLRVISELA